MYAKPSPYFYAKNMHMLPDDTNKRTERTPALGSQQQVPNQQESTQGYMLVHGPTFPIMPATSWGTSACATWSVEEVSSFLLAQRVRSLCEGLAKSELT